MTSIKSKGITINTNILEHIFQGLTNGVQISAFLIHKCHGGMGHKSIGDPRRWRGRGDGGGVLSCTKHSSGVKLQNLPTHMCVITSEASSWAGPSGCCQGYRFLTLNRPPPIPRRCPGCHKPSSHPAHPLCFGNSKGGVKQRVCAQ